MKVVEKKKKYVELCNLKHGNCFLFQGEVYLKVLGEYTNFQFNSLCFKDGNFKKFHEHISVMPVECTLSYEICSEFEVQLEF